MRPIFLYLLLSLTLSMAQRSNYDNQDYVSYIKGIVLDNSTNQPIEYATIKIINPDDNTVITGTISNEDGYFKLDKLQPGKYNITIEFIGYDTIVLSDQIIVPPNMTKNLGELKLIASAIEVETITVEEAKPFIEEKLDKKVYNVEEMGIATGGTADEILEKLPSVNVDIDGWCWCEC